MITFFDLIKKDDFRDYVSKRISAASPEPYEFPKSFPKLYKYRSMSSYTIDDIVNCKMSLSAIGEFNDVFDGAMHQYGSKQEREKAAEAEWEKLEALRIQAQIPEGYYDAMKRDDLVKPLIDFYKRESRLKFRNLECLSTYVCCFSKNVSSTLMWAHYADSNKGFCIEYDFNTLPADCLYKKALFPVAYTPTPIDVVDLLNDTDNRIFQYPIDAAALCTALNKSSVWQYEQEWRLILMFAPFRLEMQRLTVDSPVQPSRICLGFHFLKSFFYRDYDSEHKKSKDILKKFMELIAFMQKQDIKVAFMIPLIGSYRFYPFEIPIDKLQNFMVQNFPDESPQNMRFYHTIHDRLMDLIEQLQEDSHA